MRNEGVKMNQTTRVILADDSMEFCESLQMQLKNYTGMDIVGRARDGAELLSLIGEKQPDVVVTDVEPDEKWISYMQGKYGAENVKLVQRALKNL